MQPWIIVNIGTDGLGNSHLKCLPERESENGVFLCVRESTLMKCQIVDSFEIEKRRVSHFQNIVEAIIAPFSSPLADIFEVLYEKLHYFFLLY